MIHRVVLIKLTEDAATDAVRRQLAAKARQVLPEVPGVRAVTAGLPGDERTRRDWDLFIGVRFDRVDDVEPYLSHPVHRAYVDDHIAPRLEVIKAWNFDVEDGA